MRLKFDDGELGDLLKKTPLDVEKEDAPYAVAVHPSQWRAWQAETSRTICDDAITEASKGAKFHRLHVVGLKQGVIRQGTTIDISRKNGEFYYISKNEADNEREN